MPQLPIDPEYNRFVPPIDHSGESSLHSIPAMDDLDMGEFTEMPDGSVVIPLEDEMSAGEMDFYANLAEYLSESERREIAKNYLDFIDKDREARSKRDKQYEEGIRRTGLGDDAPGGAHFSGASKVVHPVMAEGCVDFSARAMKEIFPAKGPVRTQIIGESTPEKLNRAERKKQFMNWQLTSQVKEYRPELEQMLTQLPLGGSQYMKFWWDGRMDRPVAEFVPIDNILLPFACSSFYTSHRVTHQQDVTEFEFTRRVKNGMYRDVDLTRSNIDLDTSASQTASDKIEGRSKDAYNEDGLRRIYEVYTYLETDDPVTGGESAPYIVTIDDTTSDVLAIYRNWDEEDDSREKQDWIVEFQFIPWRGAYGVGLPHLIGGLSAALTGALRALLDSAHISNAPTLIKMKSGRMGGQSQQVEVTQIAEIEGPSSIDDIRKIIMPMPFNPPSAILMQLLDWLTGQAKGVVATAEERVADATNTMPVGTTLALIEQGSMTFSAIHARLHASQQKALEIICRLNHQNLEDEEIIEELGELVVSRRDFATATDIIPVSDPNIFSESQRYAQNQAMLQLATTAPQMYNMNAVHRRVLQQLRIDNVDELLPPNNQPQPMDAAAENMNTMLGTNPIKAFEGQDHLAHIETHIAFMTNPLFGANPMFAGQVLPVLVQNVKEHLAMFYNEVMHRSAMMVGQGMPIQDQRAADQMIALASRMSQQQMGQALGGLPQILGQIGQMIQQMQPKPPMDPAAEAMLQASMAETQRKAKKDQADVQLAAQKNQSVVDLNAQRAMAEHNQVLSDLAKNKDDNETALRIAATKVQADMLQSAIDRQEKENRAVENMIMQHNNQGGSDA